MKKILIIILLISLFVNWYFLLSSKKNIFNDTEQKNKTIDNSEIIEKKIITLDQALKSPKKIQFFTPLLEKENVNVFLFEYNIFKKIKNTEEFKKYRQKFSTLYMFVLLVKINDKDNFLKYVSYLFDINSKNNKNLLLKKDFLKKISIYYDKVIRWDINKNININDSIDIALSNLPLDKKLKYCEKNKLDTEQHCKNNVNLFLVNNSCERIIWNYPKLLCKWLIKYMNEK